MKTADIVDRPEAPKKKINCREEFELCYLRHKYLRRAKVNPTEADMAPFEKIISMLSRKTYYVYYKLFKQVGLGQEDLHSVGQTHLVSYLGLFSVTLPENLAKFTRHFRETMATDPTPKDLLDKDKADFVAFLKQRFQDMVRICRQKNANIKGHMTEKFLVYYGTNPPPADENELVKNYSKLGFKKLNEAKFTKLCKQYGLDNDGPVVQIEGLTYIVVKVNHQALTSFDVVNSSYSPYDSIHNLNPEELLIKVDRDAKFERRKRIWKKTPRDTKLEKIKDFISANKDNPIYTDEVKIAMKMVKRMTRE